MARDNRPYIGIDLGGTNMQAGVVDEKHRVLARNKKKTKAEEGQDAVIKRVVKTVEELLVEAKLTSKDIGGLGIGAPGAIDISKGVVLNAVNLRWKDFPLAKVLGKELGLKVVVDNDVNVGTWGEVVAGAAKGYDDVLGVFVGTGIGGGIVINGKLYHGHYFTAGEIGHTIIHADAPLGRRTFENCASRTSIAKLLSQLIQSNHPSKISAMVEGDYNEIRSKVIAKAYEEEDDLTLRVVADAAKYVGISIANMVTVLSLPCVVLGGGFTDALGKRWVESVRQAFKQSVFPSQLASCKLVASELGDDAGVVGAADLARNRDE